MNTKLLLHCEKIGAKTSKYVDYRRGYSDVHRSVINIILDGGDVAQFLEWEEQRAKPMLDDWEVGEYMEGMLDAIEELKKLL